MKNQKINVKAVSCEGNYSKEVEPTIAVKEVDKRPKVEFVQVETDRFEMFVDNKRVSSGYGSQLGVMLHSHFGLRALIEVNIQSQKAVEQYVKHYPIGMLMDDDYTKMAQNFWQYLSSSATSIAVATFSTYKNYKKLLAAGYTECCAFHFAYDNTLRNTMKYGFEAAEELIEIEKILANDDL